MRPLHSQHSFGSPVLHKSFYASFKTYRFTPIATLPIDLPLQLDRFARECHPFMAERLRIMGPIKYMAVATVKYIPADPEIEDPKPNEPDFLHTTLYKLYPTEDFYENFALPTQEILNRNSGFLKEKSGLVLSNILHFDILLQRYNTLAAAGYKPLPAKLLKKHCIINVRNDDDMCFAYAVCACLHQIPHDQHTKSSISLSPTSSVIHHLDDINIHYPVAPNQIPELEAMLKVRINVFTYNDADGEDLVNIYATNRKKPETEVDLLYFEDHYAWIKDFNRFASGVTKGDARKFFCKKCVIIILLFCKRSVILLQKVHGPLSARTRTGGAPAHLLARELLHCQLADACGRLRHQVPQLETLRTRTLHHLRRLRGVSRTRHRRRRAPRRRRRAPPHTERRRAQTHRHRSPPRRPAPNLPASPLYSSAQQKRLLLPHRPRRSSSVPGKVAGMAGDPKSGDGARRALRSKAARQARGGDTLLPLQPALRRRRPTSTGGRSSITTTSRGGTSAPLTPSAISSGASPTKSPSSSTISAVTIPTSSSAPSPTFPQITIRPIAQTMEKYLQVEWGEHYVFRDSLQFLSASLESLANSMPDTNRSIPSLRRELLHLLQSAAVPWASRIG